MRADQQLEHAERALSVYVRLRHTPDYWVMCGGPFVVTNNCTQHDIEVANKLIWC